MAEEEPSSALPEAACLFGADGHGGLSNADGWIPQASGPGALVARTLAGRDSDGFWPDQELA